MNDVRTPEVEQPNEVMRPSMMSAMLKTEIDSQIATARAFPRSLKSFLMRAESMATITPEIARSCEYAKPVGGKKVKGASARLAEIVASCYGNLRVSARIVSESDTEVVAQGVAHDLESNVAQSTEVAVSLLRNDGSRVGNDQVITSRAAACAKARRNALFLVVPAAICQPIITATRKVAAGDLKTLPARRADLLDWFKAKGVKADAILAWLEVKAVEDIGLEEMADLIAAQNTAKEEGVSMAVLFGSARGEDADTLRERMRGDMGAKQTTSTARPDLTPDQKSAGAKAVDAIVEAVGGLVDSVQPKQQRAPIAGGAVQVSRAPAPEALSAACKMASEATSEEQALEVLGKFVPAGAAVLPGSVPEAQRAEALQALRDLAGI